ncbi:hypothetical protein F5B20DRAFT_591567 [Whalleya microplaca]|nr:hypothetical protein F5B20DRAFT_591567 [Whalleya microplaca]
MSVASAIYGQHKAITMERDYSYDPSMEPVPRVGRNSVPVDHLDFNGIAHLKEGEQGWEVDRSPGNDWSKCLFERHGSMGTYYIPTKELRVGRRGRDFRVPDQKVSLVKVNYDRDMDPLARFICHYWSQARANQAQLLNLGLAPERCSAVFGDKFKQNVLRICKAFPAQSRAVLLKSSYRMFVTEIGDLKVTKETADQHLGYVRLGGRHHRSGQCVDVTAYVGTTRTPAKTGLEDYKETPRSELYQHKLFKGYPYQQAIMVKMMKLDGFDNHLTAMAEQTLVHVMNSCAGWHSLDRREEDNWTIETSRAQILDEFRESSCKASEFTEFCVTGANVLCPLFQNSSSGKAWTSMTIPPTLHCPQLERYTTACRLPRVENGKMTLSLAPGLRFVIEGSVGKKANLRPGQLVRLRFDLTFPNRHPKPWINVPDIGVYEEFGMASGMAAYLELPGAGTNSKQWTEVQLFCEQPIGKVIDGIWHPVGWLKAMHIIQLLEGIEIESVSDHFPRAAYTVASMERLEYDHLAQELTGQEVSYPRTKTPKPRIMKYEDNLRIMDDKYPGLVVPPYLRTDQNFLSVFRKVPGACDFCQWITSHTVLLNGVQGIVKGSCSEPGEKCDACSMFLRRPCTWTHPDLWPPPPSLFYHVGHQEGGRAVSCTQRTIPPPFGGEKMAQILAARERSTEEDEEDSDSNESLLDLDA